MMPQPGLEKLIFVMLIELDNGNGKRSQEIYGIMNE